MYFNDAVTVQGFVKYLVCALANNEADDAIVQEVAARWQEIKPVITERVAAGRHGLVPIIAGSWRARRNVAEHLDLGRGADVVRANAKRARQRQRGGAASRLVTTVS